MKLNILSIHTLRIAGIAIFLYILVLLDWTTFFSLISQVHLRLLGFSILLVFVYLFFRVLRLFLFLRINQKKISLGKCYAICAESMIYAAITPAKVGEVSKLGLLNKQGIHPTLAMLSILIERFFDLFLLLILFLAGAFYYSSAELEIIGPEQIRILGLIAFVTTGFIAFLILSGHVKRIYGYIKKLIVTKFPDLIPEPGDDLLTVIDRSWLPLGLISVIVLGVLVCQVYLLAMSLNINVNFWYIGFCYAATALVSLLPISVGGIGTREAIYIGLLLPAGIDTEAAFALSILDGVVLAYLVLAIFAVPALILSKLHR